VPGSILVRYKGDMLNFFRERPRLPIQRAIRPDRRPSVARKRGYKSYVFRTTTGRQRGFSLTAGLRRRSNGRYGIVGRLGLFPKEIQHFPFIAYEKRNPAMALPRTRSARQPRDQPPMLPPPLDFVAAPPALLGDLDRTVARSLAHCCRFSNKLERAHEVAFTVPRPRYSRSKVRSHREIGELQFSMLSPVQIAFDADTLTTSPGAGRVISSRVFSPSGTFTPRSSGTSNRRHLRAAHRTRRRASRRP